MAAHVVIIPNHFEPFKTETHVVNKPVTIRTWLLSHYGNGFVEFTRPTLCTVNGQPVMRAEFDKLIIREKDVVNFTTLPGDLVTALWIIVGAMLIASVAVALNMPKIDNSNQEEARQGDPVYTLRGQRNQIRLNDPIPSFYGKNRIYPDYAAMPYTSYKDNDQWLYQLFCVGQGYYNIHSKNIEDTPLENFDDVEVEVIQPGEEVTLFPDNVVTAEEVDALELRAPNEPGSGAVWIEDSPGDEDAEPPIEATGHWQYGSAGPFVANPTLTETDKIEVDIALPRGLFLTNNNGGLDKLTITVLFEKRLIDNAGAPLGDWTTLTTFTKELATITPQRFTVEVAVTAGRYEVRASRTDTKNDNARAGHTVQWEGMRAFLPSTRTYGNVTLIAIKARATNNLNDKSSTRFNIWATRKLQIWSEDSSGSSGDWGSEEETRSISWAIADVLRAQYGGRLVDAFIDLETLVGLHLTWDERQEFFDWGFDNPMTVWDAVKTIARVGRAVPILNGSLVTIVRDDIKLLPTAVFNQENIIADSFDWALEFPSIDEFNGLEVTYTDPDTGKPETVICKRSDEAGDNLERIKLEGCADRDQAYHWGMYIRNKRRFGREPIALKTGMEGHIPAFGDLILVAHESVKYGKGGFLRSIVGPDSSNNFLLNLSEPIEFDSGVAVYKIYIRKKDGSAFGPYTAYKTIDTTVYQVIVVTTDPLDEALIFDGIHEPPLYNIGPENEEGKLLTITSLAPGEDDTVELQSINYDERYFEGDEFDPPAKGETEGSLANREARPVVKAVLVTRSENVANEVVVSWRPARAARYYIVELSYDGRIWARKGDGIESTSMSIQVLPKFIYVRVAAVNEGQGPWAYWTGEAPVENTIICQPPTSLIVEADNDTVLRQEDGTTLPRLKASWTAPQDQLVLSKGLIRIEYATSAAAGSGIWSEWGTVLGAKTFDYILDIQIGTAYYVRVRSENQHGAVSAWVQSSLITVEGDTEAPPQTVGVTVTAFAGYNEVKWTKSTAADVSEYKIYKAAGPAGSFGSATEIGETPALKFRDPNAIAGSVLTYFVRAVDGSENGGTVSAGVDVTTAAEPLVPVTPDDPTAATKTGEGTYLTGDGTVKAYLEFSIPGLPDNALWQNLEYRRNVSGEFMIAAQLDNVGSATIRIDDLEPGVVYQVQTVAWSVSTASNAVAATSSPFTAPNKTDGPAVPTSTSFSKNDIPLSFYATTGIRNFGNRVRWDYPSDKTIAYFEVKVTITDGDNEVDYSWSQGQQMPIKLNARSVVVYSDDLDPGYVRVRAVDRSGVASAWVLVGNANADAFLSGGSMTEQDADDVAITGGSVVATTIATTSARRYKKRIRTIRGALDTVDKLRGVTFHWKKRNKHRGRRVKDFGFIADEVAKILPEAVIRNAKGKVEAVEYGKFVALLLQAVKELRAEVRRLKKK